MIGLRKRNRKWEFESIHMSIESNKKEKEFKSCFETNNFKSENETFEIDNLIFKYYKFS